MPMQKFSELLPASAAKPRSPLLSYVSSLRLRDGESQSEDISEEFLTAKGLSVYKHAVAGHGSDGADRDSILVTHDGTKVWKPMNETERDFYLLVQSEPDKFAGVSEFFPAFYGVEQLQTSNGNTWEYIVLENLTSGVVHPSVIDLKMGTRGYGDDASLMKIAQQMVLVAATTSSSLGFRLCGMRVWQINDGTYKVLDKQYGASCVVKENMINALITFLDNGNLIRDEFVPEYLDALRKIEAWFEKQDACRFYSASILLIYEGDMPSRMPSSPILLPPPAVTEERETAGLWKVRIVDFAHTHPSEQGRLDESFLTGVRGLIQFLESSSGALVPRYLNPQRTGIEHDWSVLTPPFMPTTCAMCLKVLYLFNKCHRCSMCLLTVHNFCLHLVPKESCQPIRGHSYLISEPSSQLTDTLSVSQSSLAESLPSEPSQQFDAEELNSLSLGGTSPAISFSQCRPANGQAHEFEYVPMPLLKLPKCSYCKQPMLKAHIHGWLCKHCASWAHNKCVDSLSQHQCFGSRQGHELDFVRGRDFTPNLASFTYKQRRTR